MLTKGIILVGLLSLASTALGLAVMSVDVGSEWMKIAVVSPGVPMEIALNPESKRKTNMVVSIKDGERKFGSDAMSVCVKSPKHCFSHLLDLLGKTLDNPIVQLYTKRFPHHKLESTERGTVQFRTSEDDVYSVEELLAQIFSHAKGQAESYAEQKIKDVVVTVPVFFNQAERLALISSVQLGGLNVLQLMSEPMSVALNYGMFRRKEINGTAKNIMLYDMGAQDTTVSIVGYQIVKTKEKGFSETHPQAQILGIGYDRTLGGSEITFRLREHLADEFDAMKKGSKSVREVPRAMGKLLKEAERAKLILSANTDCYAQVENVMEDIDFKVPLSRDKLQEIMADTWDRVTVPVGKALDSAGMTLEAIDQVILVGGGSRVPKVQELLTKYINKELGKNLNTDESAAMGAVYKAADLSSGFKVKKFITKEAVLFPIDVNFERELDPSEIEGGAEAGSTKKVRRTLFSKMNPYPQKKIMTFNKHVKDFRFYVNYNDLDYLGTEEVSRLGSHNITSVQVTGVAEALQKNEDIETKGVKAHFSLDESGLLSLTMVESVFEKTISVAEQEKLEAADADSADKEEYDWSKLGDTISQFFKPEDEDSADKGSDKTGTKKDDKKKTTDKKDTDKKKEKDKKKEPKKPKIETVKEDLGMEMNREDIPALSSDGMEASLSKLAVLDQADADRMARETALNELQSLNFDLMDKIYQEEFEVASTEEERAKIQETCSTVSDWLDEEAGPFTPLEDLNSRIKQLKDMTASLFARVREHKARPEGLEALEKSLENAKDFLVKSRNLTGDDGYFKMWFAASDPQDCTREHLIQETSIEQVTRELCKDKEAGEQACFCSKGYGGGDLPLEYNCGTCELQLEVYDWKSTKKTGVNESRLKSKLKTNYHSVKSGVGHRGNLIGQDVPYGGYHRGQSVTHGGYHGGHGGPHSVGYNGGQGVPYGGHRGGQGEDHGGYSGDEYGNIEDKVDYRGVHDGGYGGNFRGQNVHHGGHNGGYDGNLIDQDFHRGGHGVVNQGNYRGQKLAF